MVILVIIGLQYHFFLPAFSIRLMIISAKKKKVERRSPAPQSPKPKVKCSILSGSGWSSSKRTSQLFSLTTRPAYNKYKLYVKIILKTLHNDLLKTENMIGELLLQPPFLVHHVGTEWGVTVGSSLSAPVPFQRFSQNWFIWIDITLLKKVGARHMNFANNHCIKLIPILQWKLDFIISFQLHKNYFSNISKSSEVSIDLVLRSCHCIHH